MVHSDRLRYVGVLLVVSAVSLTIAACGGGGSQNSGNGQGAAKAASSVPDSKELTLRLGDIGVFPVDWPVFAADALGYLADEHLKLTMTTIDEPGCVRALQGGSIDACPVGLDTAMRAGHAGAKVRAVATISDPTVNSLNVAPSIKSWQDLKGKTIASQTPTVGSSVAIRALLDQHGVDPSSVRFLTVGGSSDRYAALKAGKTAAAITSQPQQFIAEDEGFPTLGSSGGSSSIARYLLANPGASTDGDAALVRLIKAMKRASAWLKDPANEQAALKQLTKVFKVPAKYAQPTYDLLLKDKKFLDRGIDVAPQRVDQVAALVSRYTGAPKVDSSQLIDNSYVKAAAGG